MRTALLYQLQLVLALVWILSGWVQTFATRRFIAVPAWRWWYLLKAVSTLRVWIAAPGRGLEREIADAWTVLRALPHSPRFAPSGS